ncbi:MAG: hypothetical protein LBH32_02135 [Dysgonamonadaceae bacterium]|jgi:hypothetical protein|nr:hypothetical protein [Dysgonamonadaceae bacterium]
MKKIIWVLIYGCLCGNLFAQTIKINFASFNHRVDSLTLVYSVEQRKDLNRVFYFDELDLNNKEKKQLTYKIKKLSDWSKIFYQWLMANKESIKFDYDGEKDWSFWK